MQKVLALFVLFLAISGSISTTHALTQSQEAISDNSIFSELGIELKEPIAKTYFVGDGILIRGRVTDSKQYALIFLKNTKTGESISRLADTNSTGEFALPLTLPSLVGEYTLVVASGNSFNTTLRKTINLVARTPLPNSSTAQIVRPVINYNGNSPYLSLGSDVWATMTIQQGSDISKSSGKILTLDTLGSVSGQANVSIQGYSLSSPSSLDIIPSMGFVWTGSVFIDRERDMIGKNLVKLTTLRSLGTMQFRIPKGQKVKSEYFLTTPSGDVIEYSFSKKYIGTDGYLNTGVLIREYFPLPETGVYKIEAVQDNGYAYFNLPISRSPYWSILSPASDRERGILRTDTSVVISDNLKSINTIRRSLGREALALDPTLSDLAQKKAIDMATYNYVGHATYSGGLNIVEFAQSQGIKISGTIGENVAGGNVSDMSLQDGLEESGSHRSNMIDATWGHIGIGYVVKNNRTYLVQLFGK